MKKSLIELLIFFVPLSLILILGNAITYSPCDTPISYRIGAVDSRFNISTNAFLQDTEEAAQIWNTAEGKQLLSYDPKGTVVVSLTFDNRQQLSNQINQLQNQVDQQKGSIDDQVAQYNADKAAFEQKVADLNAQIQKWNEQGGAPPDVFNQLAQEQQQLKAQAAELDQRAKELNQSATSYNSQIDQLDTTINDFNTSLALKPEEGLWDPNNKTITIYFDNSQDELIHTLAHELGHSMGLDHNQNKLSIMYPYSTTSITPSSDDISALNTICKKRSLIEVGQQRLAPLIQLIQTQIAPK